jgi:hypothetical protein
LRASVAKREFFTVLVKDLNGNPIDA